MEHKYNRYGSSRIRLTRRHLLGLGVGAAAALTAPHIWIPKAQAASGARGAIKHLVYVRLSGGFRFPTAFNGDVADEFNPFGVAAGVADGVQWGVSDLLSRAGYLSEVANQADGSTLSDLGMRAVSALADQISVMPTVDHEPLAGRADGNHTTGLERYLTGYVNGEAGIFTRIMRGLATRYDQALKDGVLLLPAFVAARRIAACRGLGLRTRTCENRQGRKSGREKMSGHQYFPGLSISPSCPRSLTEHPPRSNPPRWTHVQPMIVSCVPIRR